MRRADLLAGTELARRRAVAQARAAIGDQTPAQAMAEWSFIGPAFVSALLTSRTSAKQLTEQYLTDRVSARVGFRVEPVTIADDALSTATRRNPRDITALLRVAPQITAAQISAGMDPDVAAAQTLTRSLQIVASEPFRVERVGVDEATATDPRFSGWTRVAEAGACDFCEALASRGAVYYSDTSALAPASDDLAYHNNCRCYAEEVVDATVARAVRRAGEAAWRAQVEGGRIPSTQATRTGASGRIPEGYTREMWLAKLDGQIRYWQSIADESSRIPGRTTYAMSQVQTATRARERVLITT